MVDAIIATFCARQRELLELELKSEQEEEKSATSTSTSFSKVGAAAAAASAFEDGSRSHVLHQLEAVDISVGLYGRTVVRLQSTQQQQQRLQQHTGAATATANATSSRLLPAHRFTTGDEVEIRSKSSSGSQKDHPGGVVSEVTEESITVALFSRSKQQRGGRRNVKKVDEPKEDDHDDDSDDDLLLGSPPYSLLPKSSVEVHKKLMMALDELEKRGTDHPVAGRIVQALFEVPSSLMNAAPPSPIKLTPLNNNLDESQIQAITFALDSSRPVSLIHGPPGTGKTTTVVEAIQQAVYTYGYKKVLVTAPSNVAVDNVLARLIAQNNNNNNGSKKRDKQQPSFCNNNKKQVLRVVRLGHPARLQADILPYSLEALVQGSDETEIVQDVRRELQTLLQTRRRRDTRDMIRREIKSLRQEIRTREERVVQGLLGQAQVVLATCVGAASKLIRDMEFDLVVIDEAAQALEASCWIPALKGRKLVLAGDHCQLQPTIKCNGQQVQEALGKTMFERLMELYGDDKSTAPGRVSRMLQVQYRMHQQIADWASQALYKGALRTHDSVRDRTLSQLNGFVATTETNDDLSKTTLLLIDTTGCALHESTNAAGSRFNEGEAQLVSQHVHRLLEMGVEQNQIAVITPYNAQVEVLRTLLLPDAPKLEIRSVDGFQGGEREAVVLSLVRSSERGGMSGIGFLRDDRRLNVAVTRAKRHCCVICDTETVSQSSFVKNLISWIEEHGEQRSALEYMDSDDGQFESDLRQAQAEMEKLMKNISDERKVKEPKLTEMARKTQLEPSDISQRVAFLEKIRAFASTGHPGDEMQLSTELSKGDRRAIHELSEELGILHVSSGVEGVDRRITISIPPVCESGQQGTDIAVHAMTSPIVETKRESDEEGDEIFIDHRKTPSTTFATLTIQDDDSSEEEIIPAKASEERPSTDESTMNNVLGALAKERTQREAQKKRDAAKPAVSSKKNGKKDKKKGGQKLGGAKREAQSNDKMSQEEDDLDDIAFLDAQINEVQTSHGRTIAGTGSSYKTIVNGILLAKPKPGEAKRDPRASAALQSKLKQAQNERKAKGSKKKK